MSCGWLLKFVLVLAAVCGLSCSASRLQCRHTSEPDCWLPEYVEWHRTHRGRPDAKYLVWVCYRDDGLGGPDAPSRNVYADCAGLGDRLRGIHYLTRIAYAVKVGRLAASGGRCRRETGKQQAWKGRFRLRRVLVTCIERTQQKRLEANL